MISLKNKEARFCKNCKWICDYRLAPGEFVKHCYHVAMRSPSGEGTVNVEYARNDPNLCGEIGRYWEPSK